MSVTNILKIKVFLKRLQYISTNNKTKVYLDIFGFESFSISKDFDIYGYKLHFSDLGNQPLLKLLAKTGKDILIGSGGATVTEISKAIKIIELWAKIKLHFYTDFKLTLQR